jgi:hypothetical protein
MEIETGTVVGFVLNRINIEKSLTENVCKGFLFFSPFFSFSNGLP